MRWTKVTGIAAVAGLTFISTSNQFRNSSPKAGTTSIVSGAGPIRSARLRDLRPAPRTRQTRQPVRGFRGSARLAAPQRPILAPYGQLADALGLVRRARTALSEFIFPS